MKIGIVTFPTAINYGTALQAAALGKVLSGDNNTVRFIDHRCPLIDSTNSVFDFRNIFDIKYTIAHLINLDVALKRKKNFIGFRNKYIPLTEDKPYESDMLVAGSDQIWNYNLTDCDFYYFLDFPKKHLKKVSYAGSFGLSAIDEKHKERINTLLSDFDYLSVRENQASEIIRKLSDKSVPVVCDPTLLMTKEDWGKIATDKARESGYIFVYTVFNSDRIWEYAEELSRKTGLPVKTISYSKLHRRNAQYDYTAGPDDWVGYMLNADYVVTNSFHGVAFSVNFNKNFFFDMPPEKAGVGSRISDITARYALADRNISAPGFSYTEAAPDFTTANERLEEDRAFSFRFIDSFLGKSGEEVQP